MTTFYAGQKIASEDLTNALGTLGVATSDTTKNANTTLGDATGLAVALDANSTYILDGYIAYSSGATPDIKFAFSIPSGMTGHWTLFGQTTSATASVGSIDAHYSTSFISAIAAAGSDSFSSLMTVIPHAYLVTTNAGTLQLQFAQNTSNASNTIVKAGSWLRVLKVA